MTETPENPNLKRRRGPALIVWLATPLIQPVVWLLGGRPSDGKRALTVFQSYMIGDLFMALPALRMLARATGMRILCRPDCLEILRMEGLEGIPFDNAFFVKPGTASFIRTFRSAWRLRGTLGTVALDFDADPRTAFWLKVAGVSRIVSYRRPGAAFFDVKIPLRSNAVHQGEKNQAVAREFLDRFARDITPPTSPLPHPPNLSSSEGWIVSCWTRKDTKNWPLDRWDDFLKRMVDSGIPFKILAAPDGDPVFRSFQSRWSGQVEFLSGSLAEIAESVRVSKGVIGTDNFLGHMAGYYGKPVLWINGSSDPLQVLPSGFHTRCVQVDPMPCRPCGHRCTNPRYKACLNDLDVDPVWKGFESLRNE